MVADRKDGNVAQDSPPSWQQLLDLVAQLDGGEYDSVSVTYGDITVQLSRSGPLPSAPATGPTEPGSVASGPAAPPVAASVAAGSGEPITAPMLGVFYRRPAPGADPFVEPGDRVEPETTIGIIEIMKLMNPVPAGIAGVIAAFEADDGAQVQFGQVLARLEA